MKLVLAVLISCFSFSAFAATVISLPGRNVTAGATPTLIDLSAELSRQNIPRNGDLKLTQVDVVVQGGSSDVNYVLLMGGYGVDSTNAGGAKPLTVSLVADPSVEGTWVLRVRGTATIQEIRLTLDGVSITPSPSLSPELPLPEESPQDPPAPSEVNEPLDPPLPPTPDQPRRNSPSALPPPRPVVDEEPEPEPVRPREQNPREEPPVPLRPESSDDDEDLIDRRVLAVSRTSQRIDFADVKSQDSDGTYRLLFKGQIYEGFERSQLALLDGCADDLCVGEKFEDAENDVAGVIIGRLPEGRFVLEDEAGDRAVIDGAGLIDEDRHDSPVPRPRSSGDRGAPFSRLEPDQFVTFVQPNGFVIPARVQEVQGDRIQLISLGGKTINTSEARQIGVFFGCAGNLCVGRRVQWMGRRGGLEFSEVIAIQSSNIVVIRNLMTGLEVGNISVRDLR